MHQLRRIPGGLAAGLVFFALTLGFLRPTPERIARYVVPDLGDPVFNLYVLAWGGHQLSAGMPDFWDANVLYPASRALTLSDHLLGPAAIAWALVPPLPSTIAAYNLLVVGSFVLTGLAAFWVIRRGGSSFLAALLAAAGYTFSAFRWTHLNHVQILLMATIPLVLWAFDRLLAERRLGWAAAFLAVYLLHVTGGAYLAYMIHFPLLAILASRLASEGRKLFHVRALLLLVPVAALALAADLAVFLPYRETQRELGIERRAKDLQTFGANAFSYLTPSARNLYGPPVREALAEIGRPPREATLFPGLFTSLALGIGLLVRRRDSDRQVAPPRSRVRRAALAGCALLALSAMVIGDLRTLRHLGPVDPPGFAAWNREALALFIGLAGLLLLLRRGSSPGSTAARLEDPWRRGIALGGALTALLSFPIAFAPLAQLLPGMGGMRAPARFYAFTSFALALFAARGFDLLRERLRERGSRALRVALPAAACGLALLDATPFDFRWHRIPTAEEQPPVYHWLAGASDVHALLELPMKSGPAETLAMWASTVHWKPIANGFSGYLPPTYREIAEISRPLPEGPALARLRQLGITHLVIHTQDERANAMRDRLPSWTAEHEGRELVRVYDDGEDRVERILPGG